MVTSHDRKYIRCYLSAMLFLLISGFTAPAMPLDGEKTPPSYTEGREDRSRPDRPPTLDVPSKDIDSLFKEPAETSAVQGTIPMDDGSFQTQEYVVKEGEWLAKILREKGLIKEHNLPELLSILRKLNSSLRSLDMIQPGEKIIILVKVVPDNTLEEKGPRKWRYKTYQVQRGDTLSQVAMGRYGLSREQFNREYLRLFSECNPSISDPNQLSVGQVVHLPYYPPQRADAEGTPPAPFQRDLDASRQRVALNAPTPIDPPQAGQRIPSLPPKTPIPSPAPVRSEPELTKAPPPPSPEPWPASLKPVTLPPEENRFHTETNGKTTIILTDGLGTVVSRLGEEWVHSGEHFIPMTSGGHITLNATSYPIVRLQKGLTVIVDLHSALPQKMSKVLESTWSNYRVVRLSSRDDLRTALDKILHAFGYPKILKGDSPLNLGGNIPVSITGDWIVTPPETPSAKGPQFVVINLLDGRSQGVSLAIKDYLKRIGVEIIEYPEREEGSSDKHVTASARTATDAGTMIAAVLDLRGQTFKTRTNIPAYATRNKDFRFTVQADFYLEIKGRRHIIDVGGLDPDVVSLLKDAGISVLSLSRQEEPVSMLARLLEFLDVPFERGPHPFMAMGDDMSRNVKITLTGITFYDRNGSSVFATSLNLPPELVAFLAQRGYRILILSPSIAS